MANTPTRFVARLVALRKDVERLRLAHWRDMQRKVLAALEEMSPANFNVLLLVGLQGRSHEEAAEKLGISVTVAKKRLERARKFLKERTCNSDDDFRRFMPLLVLGECEVGGD